MLFSGICLIKGTQVAAVVGALDLLKPRRLVVTLLGKGVPQNLYQFVADRAVQRREYLAVCFAAEDGEWKPWTFEGWRRCFGSLSEPNSEKSCFWLSDFSLSAAGLRCGKPDALGSQVAPQSPESAVEALGFKPKPESDKRAHHDTARATTRPEQKPFRGLESGGFQGCGFKGFWGVAVRGLFAASLKGARGV